MLRIGKEVIEHELNVDPKVCPVKQNNRNFNTEKDEGIAEEVDQLLAAGFIKEAYYPEWLSNVVLVLQKLDTSGQLVKWSIELSEYDISNIPKSSMKGQILVDFVAEFSNFKEEDHKPPEKNPWEVYVDGSTCRADGGVRAYIVASEGKESYHVVRLEFKVTNNEAEYEAVLASLAIMKGLGGKEVEMKADSQVVVGQITWEYLARGSKLIKYLHQVQEQSKDLRYFRIKKIPCGCFQG
ncbi:uncharacterized protein LOC121240831 [Juglans microcarpa x Juglans regia]|uniref:uncharacterized protein LOC121240831 n=1 Tax=Juglans microcarpa x Juglans regia TaxID=2249226 RepID=UPI001B7DEDB7|nr:uncharacterized protein LOC121240831 [Juglans microcarpa x Juglans regia]